MTGESPFVSGARIDEVVGSSLKGMSWRTEQLERQLQATLGPRLRNILGGDFSARAMVAADQKGFIKATVDSAMEKNASLEGKDNADALQDRGIGSNVRAAIGLADAQVSISSLESAENRKLTTTA